MPNFTSARQGGVGGGILYPDSAARPFSSNLDRNTWANNNKSDLIKDTTVVNVSGTQWYLWTGESNPDSVDSNLWMPADQIISGERGVKGDKGDTGEFGQIVSAEFVGDDIVFTDNSGNTASLSNAVQTLKGDTVKISSIDNEIDANGKLKTTVALNDGTSAESAPLQLPAGSEINLDGEVVSTIYTESSIDAIIEDGAATLSVNNRISNWTIDEVGIGDSPYIIDKAEQLGIEYQYKASSQFTQAMLLYTNGLPDGAQVKVSVTGIEKTSKSIDVFQNTSEGTLSWPVVTPTVFTLRSGIWRVEESSQMIHVTGATTYDGAGANKTVIHGIAVDPSSDLTAAVSEDGLLVIGLTYTPPTDTIDIAFWWSDNAEPTADDILNAMSQTQTVDIISHTDDFYRDDLQKRTMTAKRDESSFKYLFFAWHKGFFNTEPTKVDTGWGAPSTWIETEVSASGVLYKVLTVEVKNNSTLADDYALIQEGIR